MPERDAILRDEIAAYGEALVVPPPDLGVNRATQQSGVFDSAGGFVPAAVTWRPGQAFNTEPERPPEAAVARLGGEWMFGGPMFGHFGHFLMDSLARVWAYDRLRGQVQGLVFTPKNASGNVDSLLRAQGPLLRALGVDCEVRVLTRPTRVERLHVPWQGIGLSDGWELGSPAFRDYMRRFGGKGIAPAGGARIYLSRSGLAAGRASYLSETVLEAHLAAAGYEVLHPQRLPKEEQVARYRAARWIVSPDGSPLHLLAYVGGEEQQVAVIARRSAETHSIFEGQIAAFTGARVLTVNCLRADWVPAGQRRANRISWGELDLPRLRDALADGGFLPPGTPTWDPVPEAEVAAEVARISEQEGMAYARLDGDGRPARPAEAAQA